MLILFPAFRMCFVLTSAGLTGSHLPSAEFAEGSGWLMTPRRPFPRRIAKIVLRDTFLDLRCMPGRGWLSLGPSSKLPVTGISNRLLRQSATRQDWSPPRTAATEVVRGHLEYPATFCLSGCFRKRYTSGSGLKKLLSSFLVLPCCHRRVDRATSPSVERGSRRPRRAPSKPFVGFGSVDGHLPTRRQDLRERFSSHATPTHAVCCTTK